MLIENFSWKAETEEDKLIGKAVFPEYYEKYGHECSVVYLYGTVEGKRVAVKTFVTDTLLNDPNINLDEFFLDLFQLSVDTNPREE